ncbi:MAG: SPOR domain-containing protein [Desulfuromonadales bacterium]
MSEKGRFKVNFADHDDDPESSPDDQDEVQKSGSSAGHFPENNQNNLDEFQELDLSHIVNFPEDLPSDQYKLEDFGLGEDVSFLETDLSTASSGDEHAAEEPMHDESEQLINSAGDSIKRMLLIVILLVVAGGAGVYYFMSQDVTAPTEPATAQTNTGPVALPPVTDAEPVEQNTSANVPAVALNPPAIPAAKSVEKVSAETPQEQTLNQPVGQVAGAVSEPQVPVPPPVEPAESAVPPVHVTGGAFTLDVGSYLIESNRDSLVAKIKKLGYEPLVTSINATLDMTRLSLGTYGKDEVQGALDFARSIEPGSYSAPAGERYVVYAGTFQKLSNVEKLSQRFLEEGVKAYSEPVKVTRTLSRIRFGRFTTKEDAASAARKAAEVGLSAAVVRYK